MTTLRTYFSIALLATLAVVAAAAGGGSHAADPPSRSDTHVLLVGHGAPPTDYPRDRLREFFRLSTQRGTGEGQEHKGGNDDPTADQSKYDRLERNLRAWPRTPENDPYSSGVKAIAACMRKQTGMPVWVAFNEFCDPTIDEAVDSAVAEGAKRIVAVSTMLVPGGRHSEVDIPERIAEARKQHPGVTIIYGWAYDATHIAALLSDKIQQVQAKEADGRT